MARTLVQWREATLAWHTTGYTNGPVQGLNSLIKKIKRVAAGFRSFANYRLRISWPPRSPRRGSPGAGDPGGGLPTPGLTTAGAAAVVGTHDCFVVVVEVVDRRNPAADELTCRAEQMWRGQLGLRATEMPSS